ncbi:MAG: hypothetical protein M0R75_10960 [Dehalococcoidia bacterium]|nr:hypothetical protein [Dehalococcoidia bacterium]
MTEEYLAARRLYRELDTEGLVRALRPAERNRPTSAQLPRLAADEFLAEHASELQIQAGWLTGAEPSGAIEASDLTDDDIELRFDSESSQFDSTTVAYQQTWRGIPVWRTGLTVTMRRTPMRVSGVQTTCYPEIEVDLPTQRVIDARITGARGVVARALNLPAAPVILERAARVDKDDRTPQVVSNRLVLFRYEAARRLTDDRSPDNTRPGAVAGGPAFPFQVPDAPDIPDGAFRLAREVIFSVPTPPRGHVTWLAIIDLATSALLYLRPFTADVSGQVFQRDPLTAGGTALPDATAATLNGFRTTVTLPGLTAPAAGNEQELTGQFVRVQDFEVFTAAPPTEPAGTDFNYGSRTNDFAAVNAYYHNDGFFRLADDLGFTTGSYFGGTSFPLSVDHRGRFGSADGIEINASCSGNGMGGIANVDYELASTADTTNPIGLATDRRVVLHELGGHGILYDHVNSANFGFAHSAGDSFAAILSDPDSQAADRFLTFPWVGSVISRRHDRPVGGGWGWGGANDTGGYSSEQVLSTSHFRLYRSLGGDSTRLGTRQFAARVAAYLILRGVGTLTPMTNPSNATGWVQALLDADAGDWTSEGLAGGAYGKVIRWAFEKQGLFQAPGAPTPVTQEGAAPAVDVYIDDGRHGEYQYQPVHWNNQSVWNRRYADNGTVHEEPWLDRPNFAYTRVRNRGTQTATNVIVRGFHCNPGAGLTWPDDWQAMTTAQISVPNIPPGGEVLVGPFTWTPSQPDHECMLMVASASGDPSNIDVFGPGDSIEEWRLVPHDNNIGQRNVHPVPAAGGVAGIMAVLDGRAFTVHNPFNRRVRVQLDITLPKLLASRGWRVEVATPGGVSFGLPAGGSRQVRLRVVPGGEVTAAEVRQTPDREVVVTVAADDIGIGGMSYELDPERAEPLPQDDCPKHSDKSHCDDRCHGPAQDLLRCLDLPSVDVGKVRLRSVQVDIEVRDC